VQGLDGKQGRAGRSGSGAESSAGDRREGARGEAHELGPQVPPKERAGSEPPYALLARTATRVPARPAFRMTGSPSSGPCLCLAPGSL
jgi:hypothetical protein